MDFPYWWKTNNKGIQVVFPILFFSGDTMGHNKLCSLHDGSKGILPCWLQLCSTSRSKLDSPNKVSIKQMTNGTKIKEFLNTNPRALKEKGYYTCQNNILYKLQFCDLGGLNYSLPPDILHAVLLGYVTRLLEGFAHLKKKGVTHILYFLMHIKMK